MVETARRHYSNELVDYQSPSSSTFTEYTDEEMAALFEYQQECLDDWTLANHVREQVEVINFVSKSKGWRNGRRRIRRRLTEVTLIRQTGSKRYFSYKDGGGKIDVIADEVLSGLLPKDEREKKLMEILDL